MAELSDSDVRQISNIFAAVQEIRLAVVESRNLARDIRTNTMAIIQSVPPNNIMYTTLTNLQTTLNAMRIDMNRLNEGMSRVLLIGNNLAAMQQLLARVEVHTQGSAAVATSMDQIRQYLGNLQQLISGMEQFMTDVSRYIRETERPHEDSHKKDANHLL